MSPICDARASRVEQPVVDQAVRFNGRCNRGRITIKQLVVMLFQKWRQIIGDFLPHFQVQDRAHISQQAPGHPPAR